MFPLSLQLKIKLKFELITLKLELGTLLSFLPLYPKHQNNSLTKCCHQALWIHKLGILCASLESSIPV